MILTTELRNIILGFDLDKHFYIIGDPPIYLIDYDFKNKLSVMFEKSSNKIILNYSDGYLKVEDTEIISGNLYGLTLSNSIVSSCRLDDCNLINCSVCNCELSNCILDSCFLDTCHSPIIKSEVTTKINQVDLLEFSNIIQEDYENYTRASAIEYLDLLHNYNGVGDFDVEVDLSSDYLEYLMSNYRIIPILNSEDAGWNNLNHCMVNYTRPSDDFIRRRGVLLPSHRF